MTQDGERDNGFYGQGSSSPWKEIFVNRNTTRALASIGLNRQKCHDLRGPCPKSDLGHAKDHTEARWLLPHQERTEDFLNAVAKKPGMQICVEGKGGEGSGCRAGSSLRGAGSAAANHPPPPILASCQGPCRVTEVEALRPDLTKTEGGFRGTPKSTFDELVAEVLREDVKSAERHEPIRHTDCQSMHSCEQHR